MQKAASALTATGHVVDQQPTQPDNGTAELKAPKAGSMVAVKLVQGGSHG